jgi:hypothetical protein
VICDAVQIPKGSFEARDHWSGEQAEGYVKKDREQINCRSFFAVTFP